MRVRYLATIIYAITLCLTISALREGGSVSSYTSIYLVAATILVLFIRTPNRWLLKVPLLRRFARWFWSKPYLVYLVEWMESKDEVGKWHLEFLEVEMYDKQLAKREERAMMRQGRNLINLTDVLNINSTWDTSHECECCGKPRCGSGAALVTLKGGGDAIICSSCVEQRRYAFRGENP